MNTHDDKMIGRLYMRLLPIQIVLVIISGVNNIIDSAFVGNLIGPEAMAVVGLFFPVLNLINSINVLFSNGAQIMCGKYLGKHMFRNPWRPYLEPTENLLRDCLPIYGDL